MAIKFIVNAKFLERPDTDNNGVLRFTRELSVRLKALDKNIIFLASENIEKNRYSDALQPVKFGKFKGALWEQIDLPLYMYRHYRGYYLINLNNLSPVLYNKNISSVLDLTWKHFPETFDKKSKIYLSLAMPLTIKTARKILTISHFSKKDILEHYKVKENDIKVIYPGFYYNNSFVEGAEKILENNNISPGKYFLATMYKNPGRLIESFKNFKGEGIKLVFFGKLFEDVFGHLMEIINASDNIVYLGKVSDAALTQLYAHALAFVYPSQNEGFGMPPLEAMNCNCPVVASDVSCIPEVCGEAAIYLNPYDIEDILKALYRIYEDAALRQKLIENGQQQVKKYSYDNTATELLAYLKELGLY